MFGRNNDDWKSPFSYLESYIDTLNTKFNKLVDMSGELNNDIENIKKDADYEKIKEKINDINARMDSFSNLISNLIERVKAIEDIINKPYEDDKETQYYDAKVLELDQKLTDIMTQLGNIEQSIPNKIQLNSFLKEILNTIEGMLNKREIGELRQRLANSRGQPYMDNLNRLNELKSKTLTL